MKKITGAKATDTAFYAVAEDGVLFQITVHKEHLWNQGVVIFPPQVEAGTAVVSQNPADDESPLDEIENAARIPALAKLQSKWAADQLENGWHDLDA